MSYTNSNLDKYAVISKKDLKRSRPGKGLKIKFLNKIIGKKINRKVKIGMPVKMKDFQKNR